MFKKIIQTLAILFLLQPTTSCAFNTLDMYKDQIHELNRDPKTRVMKGNENDLNDLSGCPILFKMEEWKNSKYGGSNPRYIWDRATSWFDGKLVRSGGYIIDFRKEDSSLYVTKQPDLYPIYIGPWHFVSKLNKQIRFFAYQKKEGGKIYSQYESMTEENKNIKEKSFSLSPISKYAPDNFNICTIKWIAKYGYNAVADLHENPWYPLSDKYLIGSGKIIEAKE